MAFLNFMIIHEISRFFTISAICCGHRKCKLSMYSHMIDTLPKIESFISCQTKKIGKMTNFVLQKLQSEIRPWNFFSKTVTKFQTGLQVLFSIFPFFKFALASLDTRQHEEIVKCWHNLMSALGMPKQIWKMRILKNNL